MEEKKKILLVDDEVETCKYLGDFLELRGYEVQTATGGEQALSILKDTFFPVVLLDIKMPGVDGVDVLKDTVKRHPQTKVIMVTGFTEGITKEECVEMGAYDYLAKPIDVRGLVPMLDKLYQ